MSQTLPAFEHVNTLPLFLTYWEEEQESVSMIPPQTNKQTRNTVITFFYAVLTKSAVFHT